MLGVPGTIGKLAVGIKVTDRDGRRLTLLRSIGRYGGELLSMASLSVGYVMAGFTRRRQALHDMLAGTLVVRREVTPETLTAVPEAPRLSVFARTVLVLLGVVWVGLVVLAVAMSFSQRYRATKSSTGTASRTRRAPPSSVAKRAHRSSRC